MSKYVKIYGTSTCPYCMQAKSFLRQKNVPFEEVDVGADPKAAEEMVQKSGQMGVPVFDIGGEVIVGFDKDAVIRALGL